MSKISRNEAKFFFETLTIFWSKMRIAKKLGVTNLTVTRWVRGETLPSSKYREDLRQALDDLLDELEGCGPIGQMLANEIESRIPLEKDAAIIPPASRRPLRSIITQMLEGKTQVKSTKIMDEAARYGYSPTQVHQTSRKMGVLKNKKGFGQNSYSFWRLP